MTRAPRMANAVGTALQTLAIAVLMLIGSTIPCFLGRRVVA